MVCVQAACVVQRGSAEHKLAGRGEHLRDWVDAPVIRRGIWLYDGVVRCEVRIIRQSTFYGSGDYEDPPGIADDRECECFGLLFETTTGESPRFVGGGQFETLEGAIRRAEELFVGGVEWYDAS